MMRAAVCRLLDGPEGVVVEDVAAPELKPSNVRVAVRYAALNFMDLLIIAGKYQHKPPLPFILGHDAAGVILEVGDAVKDYQAGDRVSVGATVGAFAEQIVVPASEITALPATVSLAVGAAYRASYCSALYALEHRAQLQADEHLIVTGAAGGVGIAAVQLGRLMGAQVTGIVGNERKRKFVSDHGGNSVIVAVNTRIRDEIRAVTGPAGADVVLDTVGGEIFNELLHCAAWDARILVLGFASGNIQQIPANLVMLKSASLVGVNYGAWHKREPAMNRALHAKLLGWIAAGNLVIQIDSEFPLARVGDALQHLASRRSQGKVLIAIDS